MPLVTEALATANFFYTSHWSVIGWCWAVVSRFHQVPPTVQDWPEILRHRARLSMEIPQRGISYVRDVGLVKCCSDLTQ